jgi:hypothetical protein
MTVFDEEVRTGDKLEIPCPLTKLGRFVALVLEGIWI